MQAEEMREAEHRQPDERRWDPEKSAAKPKRGAYRQAKEGTEHLLVRGVPQELLEELGVWAERDHRSRNAEVIAALEEWLAERRRRRAAAEGGA
ncbi:MAG TPA: Arc family DNA-binding protein [Ktedonobacterales bacterium]|nr:Arc family DNA-binding protein [Ktedonobacterales bacterium]